MFVTSYKSLLLQFSCSSLESLFFFSEHDSLEKLTFAKCHKCIKGSSLTILSNGMKLMSVLSSLKVIYPNKFLCAVYYVAQ